jgi:hypothetical protein
MDQDMEADEFFPDKLMPEAESVETSVDISKDSEIVEKCGAQTIAGESVVNGNDGGRVIEDMETDEPTSVPGKVNTFCCSGIFFIGFLAHLSWLRVNF